MSGLVAEKISQCEAQIFIIDRDLQINSFYTIDEINILNETKYNMQELIRQLKGELSNDSETQ